MHDILHLLRIHAAPERVYQALTTAEGIHKWWTRDAELDSTIGGACEFRFYEGKGITRVGVGKGGQDAPATQPRRTSWGCLSGGGAFFHSSGSTFLNSPADRPIERSNSFDARPMHSTLASAPTCPFIMAVALAAFSSATMYVT